MDTRAELLPRIFNVAVSMQKREDQLRRAKRDLRTRVANFIEINGGGFEHFNVNKNPTRCNSLQIFIHCKVTLHISGVTAPIIRSTKNCNRSLRYRTANL